VLPTITVDIGTTSVKLCMFGADGVLASAAKRPTPTIRDALGEIYDTDALQRSIGDFVGSIDPAVRATVRRIAIAGVGESGGLVHGDGSLASPMVLWHDHRGADRLASLSDADRARVYSITGLPVNANYGLSKVAWAVEAGGAKAEGAQWLNVAEYVAATLTGQRWSEYSLASRTMALDLEARTWSEEMCAMFELNPNRFPELRTALDGAAIAPAVATALDVDTSVVVHVAGHDHMVGAAGAALTTDEMLNSTGTTEGVLFLSDTPSLGPDFASSKLANGISCTGTEFTLFASIPTGGSAFATLQSLLGLPADRLGSCIDAVHQEYVEGRIDLDRIPMVLPQFRGSPPPTKNAAARGVIAGIGTDTSTEELVFGCFLGMVMQFQDVLNLFPAAAGEVKVIGPASGNMLWQQLKADLLGTPLSASRFPEVVSRGAQILASGDAPRWSDCDPDDVTVQPERHAALTAWRQSIMPRWEHLKALAS